MNTWKELSFFVVLSLDSKKYDFTIYGIHTTKPVVSLVAYFLSGPQLSTQRPRSVQRYNNSHRTFLLSEFLQVRTESFGRGVVEQERDSE